MKRQKKPKTPEQLHAQAKWRAIERMPRAKLEYLAAAVVEQLYLDRTTMLLSADNEINSSADAVGVLLGVCDDIGLVPGKKIKLPAEGGA